MDQLQKESESVAIVDYSRQELGPMVENICGQDGIDAWIDDANDPEPEFPEDSNEEDEDDSDKDDGEEEDGEEENDDLDDDE